MLSRLNNYILFVRDRIVWRTHEVSLCVICFASRSRRNNETALWFALLQNYRKISRQVSTPDNAPAGLGSPQAGIGGLQQQHQQQTQQSLHQPDPMQQTKDNLNPTPNQQTGALRNGNPPPPVVSMVKFCSFSLFFFLRFCSKFYSRNKLKSLFSRCSYFSRYFRKETESKLESAALCRK